MRAIDTNVLVRLIARDDAQQVKAAEAFVAKGAWVSHIVIVESMCVLSSVYELNSSKIAKAIEMLLSHKNLTLQDSEVVVAALARYLEKPAAGFSDCLVLEIARKAGHLPLGTFDHNLSKIAGAQRL